MFTTAAKEPSVAAIGWEADLETVVRYVGRQA
jgi:hypothetical protein